MNRPAIIIVGSDQERALTIQKFKSAARPVISIAPALSKPPLVSQPAKLPEPIRTQDIIKPSEPAQAKVTPAKVRTKPIETVSKATKTDSFENVTLPIIESVPDLPRPNGRLLTVDSFCKAYSFSKAKVLDMIKDNKLPKNVALVGTSAEPLLYVDDEQLIIDVMKVQQAEMQKQHPVITDPSPFIDNLKSLAAAITAPEPPKEVVKAPKLKSAIAASEVTVRRLTEVEDSVPSKEAKFRKPTALKTQNNKPKAIVHEPATNPVKVAPPSKEHSFDESQLRSLLQQGHDVQWLCNLFKITFEDLRWYCADLLGLERIQKPVPQPETGAYAQPEELIEQKAKPKALLSLASLRERFRQKCKKTKQHWIWIGMTTHSKPTFSINGKTYDIKTAAYILYKGEEGKFAEVPQDHKVIVVCNKYNCASPECVRAVSEVVARSFSRVTQEVVHEVRRLKDLGRTPKEIAEIVGHQYVTPRNAYRIAEGWLAGGVE